MEPSRACAPVSATAPTLAVLDLYVMPPKFSGMRKRAGRHQTGLMTIIKEELHTAAEQNLTYQDLKLTNPRDLDMLSMRRPATNTGVWEDLTHYIYGLYHCSAIYMDSTAPKEKATGEKRPATALELRTYVLLQSFSHASHGDRSRSSIPHRSYVPTLSLTVTFACRIMALWFYAGS